MSRTGVCSSLCPWRKLFIVSKSVCSCGRTGSDLWLPHVVFLVSTMWFFVLCPKSQLSLQNALKAEYSPSYASGVYGEVHGALQCGRVFFSFIFSGFEKRNSIE